MRITISDVDVSVPLKNLLEHTTKRIVLLQEEPILVAMDSLNIKVLNAEIIFSYGFDGSSGQSQYKQKFESPGTQSDSTLFATTIIPLRIQTENKIVLWNNRTPQSIRFCRPLHLKYAKETKELVLQEKYNINQEILELQDLELHLGDNLLRIKYKLFMTLIDGKILNILTGNKCSQSCPICGATPQKFAKVEDLRSEVFEPKPNTLQYGISPLHAWIRFFECIIHISYRYCLLFIFEICLSYQKNCSLKTGISIYRFDLSEWQVRGEKKKIIFSNRKKLIQ